MLQAIWKIAPTIAAGNTVVLKPAEQACLSVMYIGKLCQEAGIPPGVVNIVPGYGGVAGLALVQHHMVAKIMFTGSTIPASASPRKPRHAQTVGLELGGKSAVIVYEDAPIDQAPSVAAMSIFSNQGQVCTAGSRLFLHEKAARQSTGKGGRGRQEGAPWLSDGSRHDHGSADLGQAEGTRRRLHQKRQVGRASSSMAEKSRKGWKRDISSVRRSSTKYRTR